MSEQTDPNLDKLEAHRFQVPEHSADVLHQFRTEVRAFISDHPEIVGVTVYGSQVKGTARETGDPNGKSDVDAFIFIDEDLASLPSEANTGVSTTAESDNWQQVNEKIGKPFRDIFSKNAGYTEQQMKDVRVRLLSQNRIDNDINAMSHYLTALIKSENGQGERLPLDQRPMSDVARLFHLQLGKNLDVYRSYVLHELKQFGEIGDKIWEEFFYQDNLSQENGKLVKGMGEDAIQFQEKRKKLYPHTVDQAIQYFQLGEVEPKYKREEKVDSSK